MLNPQSQVLCGGRSLLLPLITGRDSQEETPDCTTMKQELLVQARSQSGAWEREDF